MVGWGFKELWSLICHCWINGVGGCKLIMGVYGIKCEWPLMVRRAQITDGGRLQSVWWRDSMSLYVGVGLRVGSWFDDNAGLVVGNGSSTLFLQEP